MKLQESDEYDQIVHRRHVILRILGYIVALTSKNLFDEYTEPTLQMMDNLR